MTFIEQEAQDIDIPLLLP